jgi:hypothetical protein
VCEIGIVVGGRLHIIKDDAWGNSNIIVEITDGKMFAEAPVCRGFTVSAFYVRKWLDFW